MQLFDRMCMALGGRAAEAKIFKRVTTGIRNYFMITAFWRFVLILFVWLKIFLFVGAEDDLRKVTDMAYKQVRNSPNSLI